MQAFFNNNYFDFFDFLKMMWGLALFLFGMSVMGAALEKRAGNNMKNLLGKITGNKAGGITAGAAVTVVTQSSSATTVMIVGFVNSGIMTLAQAINVIIGANVGTTATGWMLSLNGIDDGAALILKFFKPTSFTPLLCLVGISMYMFSKQTKKKDIGTIMLGFGVLMMGMEAMSGSVVGLKTWPMFGEVMQKFENPIMGVLLGTIITAAIQSSAASIGILQSLALAGLVNWAVAIPIVMGQNIGTTITALLSAIGATKNGQRAAIAHLSFNVIGTIIWVIVFWALKIVVSPFAVFLQGEISAWQIALCHTVFNVLTMIVMLPFTKWLEALVCKLIPDNKKNAIDEIELDERLLATPALALERCRVLTVEMASLAVESLNSAISCLTNYTEQKAKNIREDEDKTDHYEDVLSSYLVKISRYDISNSDSREAAMLLKMIGDFERISDHAVNILESAEEMREKGIEFSGTAREEIKTITYAVSEILNLSYLSFVNNSVEMAVTVEPLESVIDDLKDIMRGNHIIRLQRDECSTLAGFVWSDLLTNFERTSDHCSNIAGTVIDVANHNMNLHESIRALKEDNELYKREYLAYSEKYAVKSEAED
ncbi:MAG: Na/Pi cotransporter family protein [Clostridia bacterium]|nr:Na/Pi cotransporter family protein [Clostridia bacterium]